MGIKNFHLGNTYKIKRTLVFNGIEHEAGTILRCYEIYLNTHEGEYKYSFYKADYGKIDLFIRYKRDNPDELDPGDSKIFKFFEKIPYGSLEFIYHEPDNPRPKISEF